MQHYGIFLMIAPAKGKRPDKGKGRLRVTAPNRKRPNVVAHYKRAERALTLAQVNGGIELVQLWRTGKSVSGADCLAATAQCKKQIRIQSGSAFSFLINHTVTDSGRLMSPRINIRRDIPLTADIQIIRPPLHHGFTGVEMLSTVDIRRPHTVALLMAHLPLHGIP